MKSSSSSSLPTEKAVPATQGRELHVWLIAENPFIESPALVSPLSKRLASVSLRGTAIMNMALGAQDLFKN